MDGSGQPQWSSIITAFSRRQGRRTALMVGGAVVALAVLGGGLFALARDGDDDADEPPTSITVIESLTASRSSNCWVGPTTRTGTTDG